MADLYTSLVWGKQRLNNGELPAFMEIPTEARSIINPKFTPGLGVLNEDEERGLQCPVCGGYFHGLSAHANIKHANIGGSAGIKEALQMSPRAPFMSTKRREQCRQILATRKEGPLKGRKYHIGHVPTRRRKGPGALSTIDLANFRLSCEQQALDRLDHVASLVGRGPSIREANMLDPTLHDTIKKWYGTWNAALAARNLRINRTAKYALEDVLEGLSAWAGQHGSLPSRREAGRPTRMPLIPSQNTILRTFKTTSWTAAMMQAASLLNIYGGRYGLKRRGEAA